MTPMTPTLAFLTDVSWPAVALTAAAGLAAVAWLAGWWAVLAKAGRPGWAALVPGYNLWELAAAGGSPLWAIAVIVGAGGATAAGLLAPPPWAGLGLAAGVLLAVVALTAVHVGLSARFGANWGFGVLLTAAPFFAYPLLGFGRVRYRRPGADETPADDDPRRADAYVPPDEGYDLTPMEEAARFLGPVAGAGMGFVLAAVLMGITWVAGSLGERILLSFSAASAQRFETAWLDGWPVWFGANFAVLVKTGVWVAAGAVVLRIVLDALRPDAGWTGAVAWLVALAAGAGLQAGAGLPGRPSLLWPLTVLACSAAAYVSANTKVLAVALREFKSLLLNPLGWVVLAGFSIVLALLFSGAVNELAPLGPDGLRRAAAENSPAVLQPLTAFFSGRVLTIGLLILIPIVTMRLVSEESRSGTIEVLLTSPVPEWHVVLGKFLGAFGFYLVLWSLAGVHLGMLHVLGLPDPHATAGPASAAAAGLEPWQVASAFVGLLVIGAGFLAMGLFFSTLVDNQLAAAVLTLTGLLVFTFQGFVEQLPAAGDWAWFGQAAGYLDLRQHLEWSARGTPDSRTVYLFLSIAGLFLFLSVRAMESRRWNDMNLGGFRPLPKLLTAVLGVFVVAASAGVTFAAALGAGWPWQSFAAPRELLIAAAAALVLVPAGLFFRGTPRVLLPMLGLVPAGAWLAWTMRANVPDLPDDFNHTPAALQAVVAGLAALILYLIAASRAAGGWGAGKLVSGANVGVSALGVLVIGIMANYLAVRYHTYLDWSADQAFTLRPESLAALVGLPPDEKPAVEAAAADLKELLDNHVDAVRDGDADAALRLADKAAAALRSVPAADEARAVLARGIGLVRKSASQEPDQAARDRLDGLRDFREAADNLNNLLPEAAVADGEFLRVVALCGRYDPPKDRAEANDNFRRQVLERLFRRYADSMNRPGNVKFEYEFVDPRDRRSEGRIERLKRDYALLGAREVLVLFNNRHLVIPDEALFQPDLPMRRFQQLVADWRTEYERRLRFGPPPEPTEANRRLWTRPKEIPADKLEYMPGEEDFEPVPVRDPVTGRGLLEERFTNALLRVVRGELRVVYFTQGHGEREIYPERAPAAETRKPGADSPLKGPGVADKKDDKAADDPFRRLTEAREALRRANYQVRVLPAAQTKGGTDIPPDCSVLVIADPTEDFLPAEVAALDRFLERGGKLLMMLDPRGGAPERHPFTGRPSLPRPGEAPLGDLRPEPTRLLEFAARRGLIFQDSVAVLRASQPGVPEQSVANTIWMISGTIRTPDERFNRLWNQTRLAQRGQSRAVVDAWLRHGERQFNQYFPGVIFHEARPIKSAEGAKGIRVTPLVSTGRPGTGERGGQEHWAAASVTDAAVTAERAPPAFDGLPIVMLAEADDPKAAPWRILAVGDTDWCCDAPLADEAAKPYLTHWLRGGERLLTAMVDELCPKPTEISVRSKDLRPFQAVVRRTEPGRLNVSFREDVTPERAEALAETIRKASERKESLSDLGVRPLDRRRVYEFRLPEDTDPAEAAAQLKALLAVRDVRSPVGGGAGRLLVEFAEGTPADAVAEAGKAVGAVDSVPRTVNNLFRFTFDSGTPVAQARERIQRSIPLELTAAALSRLRRSEPPVPAEVMDKLERLSGRTFRNTAELLTELESLLGREEAAAHRDAVLAEADREIRSVVPETTDLPATAAVIHWGVLPMLLLAGGLAVHFLRRQE